MSKEKKLNSLVDLSKLDVQLIEGKNAKIQAMLAFFEFDHKKVVKLMKMKKIPNAKKADYIDEVRNSLTMQKANGTLDKYSAKYVRRYVDPNAKYGYNDVSASKKPAATKKVHTPMSKKAKKVLVISSCCLLGAAAIGTGSYFLANYLIHKDDNKKDPITYQEAGNLIQRRQQTIKDNRVKGATVSANINKLSFNGDLDLKYDLTGEGGGEGGGGEGGGGIATAEISLTIDYNVPSQLVDVIQASDSAYSGNTLEASFQMKPAALNAGYRFKEYSDDFIKEFYADPANSDFNYKFCDGQISAEVSSDCDLLTLYVPFKSANDFNYYDYWEYLGQIDISIKKCITRTDTSNNVYFANFTTGIFSEETWSSSADFEFNIYNSESCSDNDETGTFFSDADMTGDTFTRYLKTKNYFAIQALDNQSTQLTCYVTVPDKEPVEVNVENETGGLLKLEFGTNAINLIKSVGNEGGFNLELIVSDSPASFLINEDITLVYGGEEVEQEVSRNNWGISLLPRKGCGDANFGFYINSETSLDYMFDNNIDDLELTLNLPNGTSSLLKYGDQYTFNVSDDCLYLDIFLTDSCVDFIRQQILLYPGDSTPNISTKVAVVPYPSEKTNSLKSNKFNALNDEEEKKEDSGDNPIFKILSYIFGEKADLKTNGFKFNVDNQTTAKTKIPHSLLKKISSNPAMAEKVESSNVLAMYNYVIGMPANQFMLDFFNGIEFNKDHQPGDLPFKPLKWDNATSEYYTQNDKLIFELKVNHVNDFINELANRGLQDELTNFSFDDNSKFETSITIDKIGYIENLCVKLYSGEMSVATYDDSAPYDYAVINNASANIDLDISIEHDFYKNITLNYQVLTYDLNNPYDAPTKSAIESDLSKFKQYFTIDWYAYNGNYTPPVKKNDSDYVYDDPINKVNYWEDTAKNLASCGSDYHVAITPSFDKDEYGNANPKYMILSNGYDGKGAKSLCSFSKNYCDKFSPDGLPRSELTGEILDSDVAYDSADMSYDVIKRDFGYFEKYESGKYSSYDVKGRAQLFIPGSLLKEDGQYLVQIAVVKL